MKKLRILMLALLLPAFVMTGCDKGEDAQIELPNNTEKTQTAFADDETTGGFTFTAKQVWTATVTEIDSTRADGEKWLRLLWNGEETYSGAAGKFTLVIELDENYSGATRTATITIKSGNDTITITVTQDGKTETGVVPIPPDPDPDGMKYVSRITEYYTEYDEIMHDMSFDYDSKNRVVKVSVMDAQGSDYIETVSYDDAARTITMGYEEEDGWHGAPTVFKLNESGAAVSIESSSSFHGNGTFTYADGYLSKFIVNNDRGESKSTLTWSGGDNIRHVYEAMENGQDNGSVNDLSYNTSWPNNPLCNLDLNALSDMAHFDCEGELGDLPHLLGLFGNRSRHMISGGTSIANENNIGNEDKTEDITVEYDADGFVTKITADTTYSEITYTNVYTITYR